MILPDVNVLIYAHRRDSPRHDEYRAWLEDALAGPAAVGVADLVLSGFLRIVTNARVFRQPTPLEEALAFAQVVREGENRVRVVPGPRHWAIFRSLCSGAGATSNRIPDAYLAALAIEAGCEWITTDRDFRRFPDLRSRHPLD